MSYCVITWASEFDQLKFQNLCSWSYAIMLPCEEFECVYIYETTAQNKRGFGVMRWFGVFFSDFLSYCSGWILLHHHSEQCFVCNESWGSGGGRCYSVTLVWYSSQLVKVA